MSLLNGEQMRQKLEENMQQIEDVPQLNPPLPLATETALAEAKDEKPRKQ